MLVPVMSVLAVAVPDPVPAFTTACRAERSASHCDCVVATLLADPGGRFFLDMTSVAALPEPEQMPGYAALLSRHGVDAAGGSALRQRGQSVGDAAVAHCR